MNMMARDNKIREGNYMEKVPFPDSIVTFIKRRPKANESIRESDEPSKKTLEGLKEKVKAIKDGILNLIAMLKLFFKKIKLFN